MNSISSISSAANPYLTAQNSLTQSQQDFQAIGTALQSGNMTSAQSALAAFQQSLAANSNSTSSTAPANQPFGSNTQANTDYQSLTAALKSGDVSGAQSAFANLKNDLKGTHKGHHHHGSGSATAATTATTPTTASSNSSASADTESEAESEGSLNVTA